MGKLYYLAFVWSSELSRKLEIREMHDKSNFDRSTKYKNTFPFYTRVL